MLFDFEQTNLRSAESGRERNRFTEAADFSPLTVDARIQRGRRLEAVALRDFGARVGRASVALVTAMFRALRRWHEVRCSERALRSLDPHILRDIGIDGHQTPAVARGLASHHRVDSISKPVVPVRHAGKSRSTDCCFDEAA